MNLQVFVVDFDGVVDECCLLLDGCVCGYGVILNCYLCWVFYFVCWGVYCRFDG